MSIRSLAIKLGIAGALIVAGLTMSPNKLTAADEDSKLCGTATCGGEPCILCGKAEHQVCRYHANCQ